MIARLLLAAVLMPVLQEEPVRDQTGIDWVLPFKDALREAKEKNRLLMIKPLTFGTSQDGGW